MGGRRNCLFPPSVAKEASQRWKNETLICLLISRCPTVWLRAVGRSNLSTDGLFFVISHGGYVVYALLTDRPWLCHEAVLMPDCLAAWIWYFARKRNEFNWRIDKAKSVMHRPQKEDIDLWMDGSRSTWNRWRGAKRNKHKWYKIRLIEKDFFFIKSPLYYRNIHYIDKYFSALYHQDIHSQLLLDM